MLLQGQQCLVQALTCAGHIFLTETHWLLPHQVFGILKYKDATVHWVVLSGNVFGMPEYKWWCWTEPQSCSAGKQAQDLAYMCPTWSENPLLHTLVQTALLLNDLQPTLPKFVSFLYDLHARDVPHSQPCTVRPGCTKVQQSWDVERHLKRNVACDELVLQVDDSKGLPWDCFCSHCTRLQPEHICIRHDACLCNLELQPDVCVSSTAYD